MNTLTIDIDGLQTQDFVTGKRRPANSPAMLLAGVDTGSD